ncbi:MAG: TniQ family protein [Polaromonas sp.]|nr:TniQ family protein [Polaromonas sp.]MDP3752150.1 TniQ family protein [Polaromonas sp.]
MNEQTTSVLVNIEPIGVGTSMAESLESYAQRVANAHRVPRYFIDLLVEAETQPFLRPKRSSNPTCLNTPSPAAKRYAERLAGLTAVPAVRSLGLGIFSEVLSHLTVNHQVRSWCAECFAEWKANEAPPYWPQVWSFPQYRICHKHDVPLQTKCRACGVMGGTFSSDNPWKGALDQCPRCKAALFEQVPAPSPGTGASAGASQKIPGYAELAAHALGDLIASIKRITVECLKLGTQFPMLMAHCRKFDLGSSSSDLARISGLSRPTVHNLEHNEHAPCLANLVRIAVTCEVSLAGLICPDLWETTATGAKLKGQKVRLPDSGKRVYYDWDAIEKQVLVAIEAGTPEVPWVMARSMGLCEKQFCLKLGKTIYRLRHAAVNLKLSGKAGEYEDLKQRLTDAVKVAMENRQRMGRISMAQKLKIGVHNPLFVRAHKEVLASVMARRGRAV